MLIGAHVSTAGGLVNAHARGVENRADAIQVFNQSPRMWRPTRWKDDDIAAFLELMDGGPIRSVVIHAVYLVNCASKDPDIREKSLASLVHSLRMGDAIGAAGVVLHPGSTVGEPHGEALKRVGDALRFALEESDSCPLLLEDTAGAGNTLGRSFEELGDLVQRAGGHDRLGLCLDSCHLLASGFDVRTADGLTEVMDSCVSLVGEDRLRCSDTARLQPRPSRPAGRRRAGRPRLRGIPVGAALRGPAGDLRRAGRGGKGAGEGGHGPGAEAPGQRAQGTQAPRIDLGGRNVYKRSRKSNAGSGSTGESKKRGLTQSKGSP
jgi:deoxyribonuclease-4